MAQNGVALDKKNIVRTLQRVLIAVVLFVYGISLVYLYYQQTQWSGGATFESDLPAHIKMVIEDGWYYSLTALIYKALYCLPNPNLAISIFLALCTIITIVLTAILASKVDGKRRNVETYWFVSIIANMVMPCYVNFKAISYGRYIGLQSASIWHNSTYIVMKMLGVACLILYIDMATEYKQGIKLFAWLKLMLMLCACTAVKPSFLVVFAPMMALFLLKDLFMGTKFKRVFIFGLAVIPSLFVIILQNIILFGADTGNGWTINPGYTIGLQSAHPIIASILSVLFPLIVLLGGLLIRDKAKVFETNAWIMGIVGYLELFLLCETGNRAQDGNFMWGYSFTIMVVFVVCIIRWMDSIKLIKSKVLGKENILYKIAAYSAVGLAGGSLIYHLYCGIYFYLNLVQGVSYFMR